MFQAQLFLGTEYIERFPGIVSKINFQSFSYNSCGPSDYRYDKTFRIPLSAKSLHLGFILFIFSFLFYYIPVRYDCHVYQ